MGKSRPTELDRARHRFKRMIRFARGTDANADGSLKMVEDAVSRVRGIELPTDEDSLVCLVCHCIAFEDVISDLLDGTLQIQSINQETIDRLKRVLRTKELKRDDGSGNG